MTRLLTSLCGQIILFSITLLIFQLFQEELLFQRNSINDGQIWRIFTGNLVHTNLYHMLLNLVGLIFICLLFKDYLSVPTFYFSLLITCLSVGLGIYFFSKNLVWYVGLSGALYGLYIIAASLALRKKDYITSLPILIGIPAKLFWDSQNTHLTQQSSELIGAPIATDAHLYGLIGGITISASMFFISKFHKQ